MVVQEAEVVKGDSVRLEAAAGKVEEGRTVLAIKADQEQAAQVDLEGPQVSAAMAPMAVTEEVAETRITFQSAIPTHSMRATFMHSLVAGDAETPGRQEFLV